MSAQSPAGKRQAKVARRGSAEKARSSRGGAPTSAVAGRAWGEFESQYTPAFLNLKPYDFERLPRAPLVRVVQPRVGVCVVPQAQRADCVGFACWLACRCVLACVSVCVGMGRSGDG